MKPEIFEADLQENVAFTMMPEAFIVIDKKLRKYPSLRKLILNHEIAHATIDKNLHQCLIRDMRDTPRMMIHPDFHEYYKDKYKAQLNIFKQWKEFIGNIYYKIMVVIFVFPISCIIAGSYYLYKNSIWGDLPKRKRKKVIRR